MKDFADISIIDLDIEKTQQSSTAPGLRLMYLELSEHPTSEWSDFFDDGRRFPRHTMWRKAWIEEKYIVIDCAPEEIEKDHLKDLTEDVKKTNERYRAYLTKIE